MYAIISNNAGVLGRENTENVAVMIAEQLAESRREEIYIYFNNKYLRSITVGNYVYLQN